MYYRRKLILALLEAFNGSLEKIKLQKLLMLTARQQPKPDYYFVPYKFGCFSFQANTDLFTMTKYNQVSNEEQKWTKIDKSNYLDDLKENDRKAIFQVKKLYGHLGTDELLKLTYLQFPYFAINSTVAKVKLSADEYKKVLDARPQNNDYTLFTIGYEGICLEQYINKLIGNNICVLCDVRKNAISMKYGFSKTQLQTACDGVGIKYIHLPDLGISADKRQELNTQNDYDTLFATYQSGVLKRTVWLQLQILYLLNEKKRIALTCFEANINQCHRKVLADAICRLEGFNYKLKHI